MPDKIKENTDEAIVAIKKLLAHILKKDTNKADKLSFWLRDYSRLLKFEDDFRPELLKNYKRGDVVRVDFGFRVGCEFGGLHYAIVLDRHTSIKSTTLTVIPLTSPKSNIDTTHLPIDRVYLGEEIKSKITIKCQKLLNELTLDLEEIIQLQEKDELSPDDFEKRMSEWNDKHSYTKKIYDEALKMKSGSIALIGQKTTISKMRIQDPKSSKGFLSGIRMSDDALNKIDKKIAELFIRNAHFEQKN